MKKISILAITVIATIFILGTTSCKKELAEIIPAITTNQAVKIDSLEEFGVRYYGVLVKKEFLLENFSEISSRVLLDTSGNDAQIKFLNKKLDNSGPRYVYSVPSFIQGHIGAQKANLESRGWKLAPLGYLVGIGLQYGNQNLFSWGIGTICVDNTLKLNFNGQGDTPASVSLSGNTYNNVTGQSFALGVYFLNNNNNYGHLNFWAYK